MSGPVLLSLGSVNADFQVRVTEALEEGKTLQATDFLRLGGGKAANIALLARRFGIEASLLARVGDDDFAEQALAPMREAGVDLAAVTRASGTATAVSMITVPPSGKKSIVLAGNANDEWDEAAIEATIAAITSAPENSVLVFDLEVPTHVAERAMRAAVDRGFRSVLDPSFADRVQLDALDGLFAITPNAKEAGLLTGIGVDDEDGARQAAEALARVVPVVCVKLSDGGCILREKNRELLIPAPATNVVDATGAGDAFTGAFAIALLERKSALEAACLGVATSAAAVSGYGSQPSYPKREAAEHVAQELLRQLNDDAR